MDVEEQMQEVKRRFRDEKSVMLIGSPVCWCSSTLFEPTQVTVKLSEGQLQEYRGAMRQTQDYL